MNLTKQEAKRVWDMANAFQIQMYERYMTHVNALHKIYGTPDCEAIQKWTAESAKENDQLHYIKVKMEKIIDGEKE